MVLLETPATPHNSGSEAGMVSNDSGFSLRSALTLLDDSTDVDEVDIAVAQPAVMELDEHLAGPGWFELEVVDDQRATGRFEYSGAHDGDATPAQRWRGEGDPPLFTAVPSSQNDPRQPAIACAHAALAHIPPSRETDMTPTASRVLAALAAAALVAHRLRR